MFLFKLQMTRDDILNADVGSESKSPIALALKRKFPDALSVRVFSYVETQSVGRSWHAAIYSIHSSLMLDFSLVISGRT